MDTILKGILASDHPQSMKQELFKTIAGKGSMEHPVQAIKAVLKLTTDWIVNGDTSFIQLAGFDVYYSWAKSHISILDEFFTAEYLLYLMGTHTLNPSQAVILMHESLKLLKQSPSVKKLLNIVEAKAISFMREHTDIGSVKNFLIFLSEFRDCVPKCEFTGTFCQAVISAMSSFHTPVDKADLENYIADVHYVAQFLDYIWRSTDSPVVLQSLRTIFRIITSMEKNHTDPSVCLGAVVHFVRTDMIDVVLKTLINEPYIQDSNITDALLHMIDWLSWPTARNIDQWVVTFLRYLANAHRYSILTNVTETKIEQVFEKLKFPGVRDGSYNVLSHMLFSLQHSADAFHKILPLVPGVMKALRDEPSTSSINCLNHLAELFHCLMHLHAGFPELYDPLLDLIKDFPKPSTDAIKQRLAENKWTGQRKDGMNYVSRILQKSETGKLGLFNLGNTCYMNSILQALFACDQFCHSVIGSSNEGLGKNLQHVFAFLSLSQRAAHAPMMFLRASRPPWFTPGLQQDCSEFLKYFLDQMHEHEKCRMSKRRDMTSEASGDDKDSGIVILESGASVSGVKRKGEKMRTSVSSVFEDLRSDGAVSEDSSSGAASDESVSQSDMPTLVEQIFGGKLKSTYRCLNCHNISAQIETFTDLPLAFPIAHSNHGANLVAGKTGSSSSSNHSIDILSGAVDSRQKLSYVRDGRPNHHRHRHTDSGSSSGSGSHNHPAECSRIVHLNSLIGYYLQAELLTGENKYHCDNCGGLQDGERIISIVQAPEYLILTLLRFSYDSNLQTRSKIFRDVRYPKTLFLPVDKAASTNGRIDTSSFEQKIPPHSESSSSDDEDSLGETELYGLTSVIVHSGTSSDSGHYYCYARHPCMVSPETANKVINTATGDDDNFDFLQDRWHLFNDSRVSYANYNNFSTVTKRFNKDTAYVLFYKKIDVQKLRKTKINPKELKNPINLDPPLSKELRDLINRDNTLFLQEQEREARSQTKTSCTPSDALYRWHNNDDDDSHDPPSSCGGGGGAGGGGTGGLSDLDTSGARFIC